MALIDVVKIESDDDEFVTKYPSEDLRLGSQVVVNISQNAFFVKGGEIFDQLDITRKILCTQLIATKKL